MTLWRVDVCGVSHRFVEAETKAQAMAAVEAVIVRSLDLRAEVAASGLRKYFEHLGPIQRRNLLAALADLRAPGRSEQPRQRGEGLRGRSGMTLNFVIGCANTGSCIDRPTPRPSPLSCEVRRRVSSPGPRRDWALMRPSWRPTSDYAATGARSVLHVSGIPVSTRSRETCMTKSITKVHLADRHPLGRLTYAFAPRLAAP